MRRSPRRPLILKRRKLSFQQHDSLTNIQWLGSMNTDGLEPDTVKSEAQTQTDGIKVELEVEGGGSDAKSSVSDRPPYSYMAMIQFAINSNAGRRMTLTEIYTWIEDHFPFFRQHTSWKNCIRNNLSQHDMFMRQTSPDGRVTYWTIRPLANRCLTLDQAYKPGSEQTVSVVSVPQPLVPPQQTGMFASSLGRMSRGSVRKMKPLLPRSDSYLVPVQLPASAAGASIYLPSPALCTPQVPLRPAPPQRTRLTPRARKRVRIAPKEVAHVDAPAVKEQPSHLGVKPLTRMKPFNKDLDCSPLDESLTNIQWLGSMNTDGLEPDTVKSEPQTQTDGIKVELEVEGGGSDAKSSVSDRPPYSYVAMIQFAINSNTGRRMTLKEIYTWIEDHFPFFRQQTKLGWKNSIRHNLSLHDMFMRQTSPNGRVSYWTIRPEANRCLTLDQVYKPGSEQTVSVVSVPQPLVPHQEQTGMFASSLGRVSRGSVRRMKPLLPSSKEEPVCVPLMPQRGGGGGGGGGSSRRKQRLVRPLHEEPILLFPDSTFFDSDVASAFQDTRQGSPTSHELSFKTPVKGGGSHLTSSTPSKPPGPEPCKVTPPGKSTQLALLDFSPIRTPGGPLHTPQQHHRHHHLDYAFSFGGTPFKVPLFSSPPLELLQGCGWSASGAGDSPPAASSSLEALILDTMNESLSKVLGDISFSGLEDEDMGAANTSWPEFILQMM